MPDPLLVVAEPRPGCALDLLPIAHVHSAHLDIPAMDADHPEERALIFIGTTVVHRSMACS